MANFVYSLWCRCPECREVPRVYRVAGPGFFWRIA